MNKEILTGKVAIWGTGSLAKRFYYIYKDKKSIACFYDNDKSKWGTMIDGIPVRGFSIQDGYKIIIASSYWREIARQLGEYELTPFVDVDFYQHIVKKNVIDYGEIKEFLSFFKYRDENSLVWIHQERKIVVVYGNCQTAHLEKLLSLNEAFVEKYVIVLTPKVCDCLSKLDVLVSDICFWKRVDLFIYQTVSVNNRFSPILSTDKILEKLSYGCKKINIVNIFFDGYFPQMLKKKKMIIMPFFGIQINI